jgi:hypothetical protein
MTEIVSEKGDERIGLKFIIKSTKAYGLVERWIFTIF